MMLLLLRMTMVSASCASVTGHSPEEVKTLKRGPTATESAVPPYVTILTAGAASVLKPTRCSTVFGLVPMFAATATAVHRTHRCARRGR